MIARARHGRVSLVQHATAAFTYFTDAKDMCQRMNQLELSQRRCWRWRQFKQRAIVRCQAAQVQRELGLWICRREETGLSKRTVDRADAVGSLGMCRPSVMFNRLKCNATADPRHGRIVTELCGI